MCPLPVFFPTFSPLVLSTTCCPCVCPPPSKGFTPTDWYLPRAGLPSVPLDPSRFSSFSFLFFFPTVTKPLRPDPKCHRPLFCFAVFSAASGGDRPPSSTSAFCFYIFLQLPPSESASFSFLPFFLSPVRGRPPSFDTFNFAARAGSACLSTSLPENCCRQP